MPWNNVFGFNQNVGNPTYYAAVEQSAKVVGDPAKINNLTKAEQTLYDNIAFIELQLSRLTGIALA